MNVFVLNARVLPPAHWSHWCQIRSGAPEIKMASQAAIVISNEVAAAQEADRRPRAGQSAGVEFAAISTGGDGRQLLVRMADGSASSSAAFKGCAAPVLGRAVGATSAASSTRSTWACAPVPPGAMASPA